MYKILSLTLIVPVMLFLSVDQGWARDGEKKILNATMTILADGAQPIVSAKRIFLPARMQARVQERVDSQRRKMSAPTLIVPAKNQIGGLNSSPFLRKSAPILLNRVPAQNQIKAK